MSNRRNRFLNKSSLRLLVIILLLLIGPLFASSYVLSLMTQFLIYSILAMSLDLLIGYTGLVSFNHASFMGLGAYTAAILFMHGWSGFWLALAVGILAAILFAMLLGLVIFRSSGAYFLLLTLAFGQMVFALAWKWRSFTGGDDGLAGIPRPDLIFSLSTWDNQIFYYLVLIFFVMSFLLLRQLIKSTYGKSLIGIRESESRMQALGYNTWAIKYSIYCISAGFAGLAGVLYVWNNGFICPQDVSWKMSGLLILMVIIGGTGTLIGPVVGAVSISLLINSISSYTEHWPLLIGLFFIFCVIYARNGISDLLKKLHKGGNSHEGIRAKEP